MCWLKGKRTAFSSRCFLLKTSSCMYCKQGVSIHYSFQVSWDLGAHVSLSSIFLLCSGPPAEQGCHPAAAMALSSKRSAAATARKAGKDRTVPTARAQEIAVVMGTALMAGVFAMLVTLVMTAVNSCALRTAVETGPVSMGSVDVVRSSLERTAVRRGALMTAVAMGTVTVASATARVVSQGWTALKVRAFPGCLQMKISLSGHFAVAFSTQPSLEEGGRITSEPHLFPHRMQGQDASLLSAFLLIS